MGKAVFYKKRNGHGDCIFFPFPALLKLLCWEAMCLEAHIHFCMNY